MEHKNAFYTHQAFIQMQHLKIRGKTPVADMYYLGHDWQYRVIENIPGVSCLGSMKSELGSAVLAFTSVLLMRGF